MKRRALIVGINYVGTGQALRGCINDANNMQTLLQKRGFTEIKLLLEEQATTAGIIAGMEWLVKDTEPGDVVVMHYSGHGSQLPSKTEADGFEEIICPIDLNWMDKVITDDTLRNILGRPIRGVNTTVILDCCHSGTALDQAESLQVPTARDYIPVVPMPAAPENRFMVPPADIIAQLEGRETVQWSAQRDINANAMLIAGCRAEQTSADAFINGQYQGAASAAIIENVTKNPNITYLGLITAMNNYMMEKGFSQRPQLDGFGGLREETFAEPWAAVAIEPLVVLGPEPVAPTPPTSGAGKNDDDKKKSNVKFFVVAGLVLALFLFMMTR